MKSVLILFLIWAEISAFLFGRLRRQSVPSNHVQVNALESSIVLGGRTFIQSGENRIDFNELHLNGSLWSDSSSLNFDRTETYANVSGTNAEMFITAEDGVKATSRGNIGEMFIQTNRSTDGHSVLNHFVQGSANLSFDDGVMKVQGLNGKRIEMDLLTWNRDVEKKITLEAETVSGGSRRLIIDATGKPYHATIRFEGALVYFIYAGKYVRLDPTYKFIEIFTDKYAVTVRTKNAPFELSFENKEVLIGLPAEQTKVRVHSAGVNITAKKTSLDMNNKGDVNTDTNNSFILIESGVQPVGLTAAHHNLKVNDGIPHILVDPGISQVEILANRGSFAIGNLLSPFKPREDKFADIGPFGSGGTPPPNFFFPQSSTVSTVFPENVINDNLSTTSMEEPTTTAQIEPTRSTDSPLPKQAEVPEIPMPPEGNEMPLPSPLPASTERIPEVAADLPQVSSTSTTPVESSKTVVDETNTTDTKTSFEHPKKQPVVIDPKMAKMMAADVQQPTIPVTTTRSTTTMTSTTAPITMLQSKAPVTIDPLLTKSMAADLPQPNIPATKITATLTTIMTSTTAPIPISHSKAADTILPLIAKSMAADLSQPKIPVTTTTRLTTTMTSTTVPVPIPQSKAPVTIDPLMAKSMAADLPQSSVTSTKEPISIETTISLPDTTTTEPLTSAQQETTDANSSTTELTSSAIPSFGTSESTTVKMEESSTAQAEVSTIKELGDFSAGGTEKSTVAVSPALTTASKPRGHGKGLVDTETVSEDETNITDTRISMKSPPKNVKLTTDSLPTNQQTTEEIITTEVTTVPSDRVESTSETSSMNTEELTTMTATTFSTLPDEFAIKSTFISPTVTTSATELTTTIPETSTTTVAKVTTTLDPIEELKQLREAMEKMKKFREWEEEEVSHGGDGDEHVEEFTFPNGTTVHRVVKTSRRITTTITHHRKEEINDTSEGKPQRAEAIAISNVAGFTDEESRPRRHVASILQFLRKFVGHATASHALFAKLFATYNRHVRPVVNSSDVTHVNISNSLRGILDTDAVHQVIMVKEWLRMFWRDEFLQWDPKDFEGIREIKVPRSMLWLPDVTRIDLVGMMQSMDDDRSFVIVDHNGLVKHSIDQVVKVFCDYRITMFPFDVQNCTVHYEPWHSTEKEVLLIARGEPDISNYRPKWELIGYTTRSSSTLYPLILEYPTSRVFYDIVIKRRPNYYVASFMLPCFIIMELSLLGLFSPSNDSGEHNEKVTMGLTSLLSMTVLLLMISENVPKTNQGVFVLVEIFIGALATTSTVYVSHLQSGWRKGRKIPLFLRYLETLSIFSKTANRRLSEGEIFAEEWKQSNCFLFNKTCKEGERKSGLFAQINSFESNMRMISSSLQKRAAMDRHRLKWAAACEELDRALLILFLSTNTFIFVAIMLIGYFA